MIIYMNSNYFGPYCPDDTYVYSSEEKAREAAAEWLSCHRWSGEMTEQAYVYITELELDTNEASVVCKLRAERMVA